MSPNTAPDAPTVYAFGSRSRAPNDPASSDAKYSAPKRMWPRTGSSIVPSQYRMYMLKRMWKIPPWRKPAVTRRQ
jgi:hypothetical protein